MRSPRGAGNAGGTLPDRPQLGCGEGGHGRRAPASSVRSPRGRAGAGCQPRACSRGPRPARAQCGQRLSRPRGQASRPKAAKAPASMQPREEGLPSAPPPPPSCNPPASHPHVTRVFHPPNRVSADGPSLPGAQTSQNPEPLPLSPPHACARLSRPGPCCRPGDALSWPRLPPSRLAAHPPASRVRPGRDLTAVPSEPHASDRTRGAPARAPSAP